MNAFQREATVTLSRDVMGDPALYVIWSIEHDAWWAPGELGYVRDRSSAGLYEASRARAILRRANVVGVQEVLIPAVCVDLAIPGVCPACGGSGKAIDVHEDTGR